MLKHIATQSLAQSQSVAVCDNCPTVSNLIPVFNHEEGQLNYCCNTCSEKLTKGFLFGLHRQPETSQVYEE